MTIARSTTSDPLPSVGAHSDSGLLIIGHGTDEERGRAEFDRLVRQVEQRAPRAIVEGCFLEFAAPDVTAGFARLYERGARDVTVVPLLLFAAGHAKRDIPELISAAQARFPDLIVRQTDCLNCAAPLVELSTQRYQAALATRGEVSSEATLLVFVGRGSQDAEANAELCRFARLRYEQTPVARVETCFLAMTRPSLVEALNWIAILPVARVVVQPHLLFPGKLADRIAAQVAEAAAAHPDKEFVLVDPLGAEELLVQAVLLRAGSPYSAAGVCDPGI